MKSLAIALALSSVVHAAPPCNSRCNVVQKRVAVAHAVPVAAAQVQIVRTFPQAYYTTDQYGSAYGASSNAANLADVVAELRGIREALENGGSRAQAADPLKLTHQSCLKCHAGANAKGGFRVDGELSASDRLKAISRITTSDASKRMPRGKQLSPEVLGNLIGELSQADDTDEPPPNPDVEYEQPQRVE